MSKASEWVKSHKPQTAVAAVAVVAIVCVVVAAALGAFSSSDSQTGQDETQDAPKTAELTIDVSADAGWDGSSTPAIAHIKGGDVDFYHAVTPTIDGNKGTSSVELAEGAYEISFTSPLNVDGSAYKTDGAGETQEIEISANAESAPTVSCDMTRIPAEEVTDEMVQDIVDQVKTAIENGDETLKGEAGQGVLSKLEQNAAANPNASDATKEEAAKVEEEVDVNGEAAATVPPSVSSSGNSSSSAASVSGSVPANGGSSSSGSASSGSNGSSGGEQVAAHTHTWKDHTATRQVWVSNWVTVPDYETRTISGGRLYTQNADGSWTANGATYWFYTDADFAAFKSMIMSMVKNEGYTGNYQNVSKTEQVQVGSHQEDQGHYETETYVDYQYCDCGATR